MTKIPKELESLAKEAKKYKNWWEFTEGFSPAYIQKKTGKIRTKTPEGEEAIIHIDILRIGEISKVMSGALIPGFVSKKTGKFFSTPGGTLGVGDLRSFWFTVQREKPFRSI